MILGADHLALSGTDLDADCARLQAAGFTQVFKQPGLPNAPQKRDFLRHHGAAHAIAYFKSPAGPAVELTVHADSTPADGAAYEPLFTGADFLVPRPDADAGPWEAEHAGAAASRWPGFDAPAWNRSGTPAGRIAAVLVRVSDSGSARDFWESALGFRASAQGVDALGRPWTSARLASPVPGWSVELMYWQVQKKVRQAFLDAAGFNCLALLTNDIERDGERLRASGAQVTGLFEVEVNGRPLRICMARCPQGELVELIELNSKKRT